MKAVICQVSFDKNFICFYSWYLYQIIAPISFLSLIHSQSGQTMEPMFSPKFPTVQICLYYQFSCTQHMVIKNLICAMIRLKNSGCSRTSGNRKYKRKVTFFLHLTILYARIFFLSVVEKKYSLMLYYLFRGKHEGVLNSTENLAEKKKSSSFLFLSC